MIQMKIENPFLTQLSNSYLHIGGKKGTDWLLKHVELNSQSNVLVVACNQGATMLQIAQTYGCSVIGIDNNQSIVNQANKQFKKHHLDHLLMAQLGNAIHLPFENNTFDVIINESMLTMVPNINKQLILKEYTRLLKPKGKLLTHDIYLTSSNESINREMTQRLRHAINLSVSPLNELEWVTLLEDFDFIVEYSTGKITLSSFKELLKDEGLLGTLNIIQNGLKKENRVDFLKMIKFFNLNQQHLGYIVISSAKQ